MSQRVKDKLEFYKQKAYPNSYNQKMCEDIKYRLSYKKLPKLEEKDIQKYKKILEESNKEYKTGKNEPITDKLLTILEMIYYINSIEPDDKLLHTIIYIQELNPIITQIIRNKENKIIKDNNILQATTILKQEIETIIAPFTRISEGDIHTKRYEEE